MKFLRLFLILIFTLGYLQPFATPVFAASLGVIPKELPEGGVRSWFVHTLSPGVAKEDVLVVNNRNDKKTVVVAIEALDAVNTRDGGFNLVESPSDNKDVGTWVKLTKTELTLPAGGSAEVPFTIEVPNNASPGEHSGGIAVYEKSAGTSGGMQMKIRVGARMYITVPGEINRKLTFQSVRHEIIDGKLHFKIQAKNESNVNLAPTLDIRLRGLLGSKLQSTKGIGTFLPNSTIALDQVWEGRRPILGLYRTTIILHTLTTEQVNDDGSKKALPNIQFKYNYSFWVGGALIAWLIGILLALWLIFRFLIYLLDRQKFAIKTIVVNVGRGESIMHIAEKTGALPQSIITFNRLKWPYTLVVGDRLIVPVGVLTPAELFDKRDTEALPPIWRYLLSWQKSLYHPSVTRKLSEKLKVTKSRKVSVRRRK